MSYTQIFTHTFLLWHGCRPRYIRWSVRLMCEWSASGRSLFLLSCSSSDGFSRGECSLSLSLSVSIFLTQLVWNVQMFPFGNGVLVCSHTHTRRKECERVERSPAHINSDFPCGRSSCFLFVFAEFVAAGNRNIDQHPDWTSWVLIYSFPAVQHLLLLSL